MNSPNCYFQVFLVRDGGSPTKAELIIRLHVGGNREIAEETHRFSVFGPYGGQRLSEFPAAASVPASILVKPGARALRNLALEGEPARGGKDSRNF
jgi:hypothetical protein